VSFLSVAAVSTFNNACVSVHTVKEWPRLQL